MRAIRRGRVALLSLALAGLCSVAPPASSVPVECYQFTWERNNNATDCEVQRDLGIPCFEPFVLTVPQSAPPNISDLDYQCGVRDCAKYTCAEDGTQCVRYARYDPSHQPLYISRFCGTIIDVTKADKEKPTPVLNSCHTSKNDTTTIEACVCESGKCNGGAAPGAAHFLLSAAALAALLLWRSFLPHQCFSLS